MFIQIPVAFRPGQLIIFPRKDAVSKNTTGGTKTKDDTSTKKKRKKRKRKKPKENTSKHALLMPQRKVLNHGSRKQEVYPLSNTERKQIPGGKKASVLQSPHKSLMPYKQIKQRGTSTSYNKKQTGQLNVIYGSQQHLMKFTLGNILFGELQEDGRSHQVLQKRKRKKRKGK